MKKIVFVLSCWVLALYASAQHQVVCTPGTPLHTIEWFPGGDICRTDPWFLIFSDEFEGTSLDTDVWYTYFPWGPGGSDDCTLCRLHSEDNPAIFKDENVVVDDGILRITTKREPVSWKGISKDFSTGMIHANQYHGFSGYQKWEMRCKLSGEPGVFPAFWAFGWFNELDFFEYWSSAQGGYLSFNAIKWYDVNNDIKCYEQLGLSNFNPTDDFHIYTTEYDPFFVRFYFDHVLMFEVPKYQGTNSYGCNIPAGHYVRKNQFPNDGEPMTTIIGNNVDAVRLPTDPDFSSTIEIDYIKIYSRDCPWAEAPREVNADETLSGITYNYNSIYIAPGKTLTINNSTINMNDEASIKVGEGGALILNNSIITSCNPNKRWAGIKADKNALVDMSNHSKIEKAATGVTLGMSPMNGQDPSSVTDNAVLKVDSYSGFEDCMLAVYLGAGATSSYIRGNAYFRDNRTAIVAEGSTGLTIDATTFEGNQMAIRAIDSYIYARQNNVFDGGEYGIIVEGTFPGAAGLQAGSAAPGTSNVFNDQEISAIDSYGAGHAIGTWILNNRFTNQAWSSAAFMGANRIIFENNTLSDCLFGFQSEAGGDDFNLAQCNTFDNIDGFDIHYAYANSKSQFLGNSATGTGSTNCFLADARIAENIGSEDNPAGNCFSSSDDILSLSSRAFTYHYYDDSGSTMCQEPSHVGNYLKQQSLFTSSNCQGGVGIFKLIDPDNDGIRGATSAGPVFDFSGHISKARIRDSIDLSIHNVVTAGGDNPLTLSDETTDSTSTAVFEKEAVLDQWIRYAILRSVATGDYAFADSILTPLLQVRWQQQRLGLMLMQAQYEEAELLLGSLPSRNTDEAYFNWVQALNIKRLYDVRHGQQITQGEIDTLETIARSHLPSAGYARSLYNLLTGDRIRYDASAFLNLKEAVRSEAVFVDDKTQPKVTIYPNPVRDVLNVVSTAVMDKVALLDIRGKIILDKSVQSQVIEVNLEHVPAGVYLVRITHLSGDTRVLKAKKI